MADDVRWGKSFGNLGWNLRVVVEFDETAGFYVVIKMDGSRSAPNGEELVLPGVYRTLESAVARADRIVL